MSDDIDNIEKKQFEWGWGAVWSKYGGKRGNREVAEICGNADGDVQ